MATGQQGGRRGAHQASPARPRPARAAAPGALERLEGWFGPGKALGFFALTAMLYTLPLIVSPAGSVLGRHRDYYGDIFSAVWEFWATAHSWFAAGSGPFDYVMLAGPYSAHYLSVLAAHKYLLLLAPATATLGPVTAINLLVLGGLTLAGYCTYLLARSLTGRELPALAAGLIFALCPYNWARMAVHLDLMSPWPLPLLILALLRLDREPRRALNWLLLAGALAAFHAFCSIYYYLFLPLLLGSYLLVRLADRYLYDFGQGRWLGGSRLRTVRRGSWLALGAAALVLTAGIWAVYHYCLASQAALEVRPLHWQERFRLSAANLLLPGLDHPLFGETLRGMVPLRRNLTESAAYLGWAPLIFAIWGFRAGVRRWQVWMLVVLGLAGLSFTFGPYLTLGGMRLPLPSLLLHQVAPFIRAIGRYVIFAQLALAVLAAFGAAAALERWRGKSWLPALAAGLLLAAGVEYLHPFQTTPVASSPAEASPLYAALAALPDQATVFEYPPAAVTGLAFGDYLFFQTIHHRNLFNRQFDTTTIPPEFLSFWQDLDYPGALSDPVNVALLRYFGTEWITFHDRARANPPSLPLPDLTQAPGLELVRQFGDEALYRVTAAPATVLLKWDTRPYYNYLETAPQAAGQYDFLPPLTLGPTGEGLGWRIMGEQGRVTISNLLDRPQRVTLRARAVAFEAPRTLELSVDGQPLASLAVGLAPQDVVIGPLELPAGGRVELVLRSREGAARLPLQPGVTIPAAAALARVEALTEQ